MDGRCKIVRGKSKEKHEKLISTQYIFTFPIKTILKSSVPPLLIQDDAMMDPDPGGRVGGEEGECWGGGSATQTTKWKRTSRGPSFPFL